MKVSFDDLMYLIDDEEALETLRIYSRLREVVMALMKLPAVERLSIVGTVLDETLPELDMTFEEFIETRRQVQEIVGEVGKR